MYSTRPPLALQRRLFVAGAAATALFALAGCASPAWAHATLATLEVLDRDNAQVLPHHPKDGRLYVAGRPGARYALRLRNLTSARVLVVLSVDGINVVSGQTAGWQQTGYVLDAGSSHDIVGWRKSDTEVAAFEFAPIERSYAALTGRPGNVGVIGMAVFRERVAPPPAPLPAIAARSEKSAADAPAAASLGSPQRQAKENSAESDAGGARLGTGHGQREWSVSRRTAFERASSTPDQVFELEYDSRERLVAAGVIVDTPAYARPRPFPGNPVGFVPDPPNR